ncbi:MULTISPECIES: hypothetical protein [unclassified Pseudoalteromonas]|uniref:hypothetical protein n=1 Tax=unclassified Pseudoalteromonas TaxID=194690 RepID=UPI00386B9CFE
MKEHVHTLNLNTAFNDITSINFTQKIVITSGLCAYFDSLSFNDDCEIIACVKDQKLSAHFQVLPQSYQTLKAEAKALNLIH